MTRAPFQLLALLLLLATAALLPRALSGLGKIDASTESLVLEDDPDAIRYDRTGLLFSNDEFVLVGLTRPDLFTPAGVAALGSLHASLAAIDSVARVDSPVSVPLLRSFEKPPRWPIQALTAQLRLDKPGVDLAKAREELTAHELFAGNLISRDGNTAGFLVTLAIAPRSTEATRQWLQRLDARARAREALALAPAGPARLAATADVASAQAALDAYRPTWVDCEDQRKRERLEVVHRVRRVVQEAKRAGEKIAVSGVPSLVVDMVEAIEHDLSSFLLASFLFVVAFLGAAFRRPQWLLLPVLVTVTVVTWTVTLMDQAGIRMTVITANVPSLLLILSLAHSIHLVVRWRELLARFPDEPRPARVARLVRGLVWPCLFTGTTTMVGFSSLYFAGSRPIIDFGNVMAAGIGLSFLVSFLLVPAGLLVLPPGTGRLEGGGRLSGLGSLALRGRAPVLLVTLLLLLGGVLGMRRIEVEARFIDYFRPGSPIQEGLLFIDDHLGGTSGLEVVLSGEPGAFGLRHPENLDAAAEVVAWLRARKQVGVVMSYPGLLDELRKLLPPGATRGQAGMALAQFPQGRALLPPYLVLEERQVGGRTYGSYGATRIVARVRETDPELDRNALLREVRAFLAAKFPEGGPVRAEVTGMFVLYANMLDSLVGSQVWTSVATVVAIFLMLAGLYRSLGAGVLALIPNLLPIALVLGAMGWTGIPLDMATVMIASVSMGIGVDCAIHYLFRFREEWRLTGDLRASVEASHGSIGTSILLTSLTSVVGFAVLVRSEFLPNAYFGLLTGVAMIAALAGMLLLLPALLSLWNPFRREAPAKGA